MKVGNFSKFALDEAACVFGAEVLLKHLSSLAAETLGVSEGRTDIEYVHRARVASRRLRAALPLFSPCLPRKKAKAWLKEIKAVTRALGAARDTDVQIERLETFESRLEDPRCRPGVHRLLLRLTQKRHALQAPVREAMNHLAASGIITAMQEHLAPTAARRNDVYVHTPALYRHSLFAIQGRLDELLTYEAIISQPDKVTELHEMRIAAKWLRYTMETFAPLYSSNLKPQLKAVRAAQELLGDIHDCDVWTAYLPQFIVEEQQRMLEYFGHTRTMRRLIPGLQAFEQDRRRARENLYREFLARWQKIQEDGTWPDLRRTIEIPFLQPGQIYPPPAGEAAGP